jgi:hypothetical protein
MAPDARGNVVEFRPIVLVTGIVRVIAEERFNFSDQFPQGFGCERVKQFRYAEPHLGDFMIVVLQGSTAGQAGAQVLTVSNLPDGGR